MNDKGVLTIAYGEMMELLAMADLSYTGTLHQGCLATGAVNYIDALFIKQHLL